MTFFLIENKDKRSWFFKETILLANFSIDIILEISFFILVKMLKLISLVRISVRGHILPMTNSLNNKVSKANWKEEICSYSF